MLSNSLLGVTPRKGSAAFAPPNIGGVSEGRGGFAALRIPHADIVSLASLIVKISLASLIVKISLASLIVKVSLASLLVKYP